MNGNDSHQPLLIWTCIYITWLGFMSTGKKYEPSLYLTNIKVIPGVLNISITKWVPKCHLCLRPTLKWCTMMKCIRLREHIFSLSLSSIPWFLRLSFSNSAFFSWILICVYAQIIVSLLSVNASIQSFWNQAQ